MLFIDRSILLVPFNTPTVPRVCVLPVESTYITSVHIRYSIIPPVDRKHDDLTMAVTQKPEVYADHPFPIMNTPTSKLPAGTKVLECPRKETQTPSFGFLES